MASEIDQNPFGNQIKYTPRKIGVRIKSAPSIRQIYWCNFDMQPILPEMGKKRPALILSYKNNLKGHCLVLPISTSDQIGSSAEWAHQLSLELESGRRSYVICNHLYTVSTSRLQPLHKTSVPRLAESEFNQILTKVLAWLPKLP